MDPTDVCHCYRYHWRACDPVCQEELRERNPMYDMNDMHDTDEIGLPELSEAAIARYFESRRELKEPVGFAGDGTCCPLWYYLDNSGFSVPDLFVCHDALEFGDPDDWSMVHNVNLPKELERFIELVDGNVEQGTPVSVDDALAYLRAAYAGEFEAGDE